jgi:hypothetical protein
MIYCRQLITAHGINYGVERPKKAQNSSSPGGVNFALNRVHWKLAATMGRVGVSKTRMIWTIRLEPCNSRTFGDFYNEPLETSRLNICVVLKTSLGAQNTEF